MEATNINKPEFLELKQAMLSPKSTTAGSATSDGERPRKPSSSGFVYFIDEALKKENERTKSDQIFAWFEAKGIKRGQPEEILADHNELQRKKVISSP